MPGSRTPGWSTSHNLGWRPVAAAMFGVGWGANQFASLLIAYHQHRGLSVGTDQALFGVYALGLVPALLVGGPASDRYGRGALMRPAAVLSVVATGVLIGGVTSTPLLYVGRFLAGMASGVVLAVGSVWVKELSVPPYDLEVGEQGGARRAAIALSAGFGLGPVVAGLIAQWSPDPLVVAYLPHLAVMALVAPGLWWVAETAPPPGRNLRTTWSRLRVPLARHPRFASVVVPLAPWVFGAPAVAFAVLPTVVARHTTGYGIAFAGAVAGVTLGIGVAVQPLARHLDRADSARGGVIGMAAVVLGMALAALAAARTSPVLVLVAAVVLGAGYGLCLVSGLLEVQRLASPGELAGLTAVYYALTYVGFALPVVLAELTAAAGYPALLGGLAVLATGCLVVMAVRSPARPAALQWREVAAGVGPGGAGCPKGATGE